MECNHENMAMQTEHFVRNGDRWMIIHYLCLMCGSRRSQEQLVYS